MIHNSSQRGFGVIEIIVAVAMATAALIAFSQAGALALRLLRNEKSTLEATLLAEEALEAARSVRDESWTGIAWRTDLQNPSRHYYPVVVNGKWTLATSSPGLINGAYDRYVQFEKVSRDSSDKIVTSGGTDDPGTRRVIAHASSTARDIQLTAYLTNFQSYLPKQSEAVSVSYADAVTDGNLADFPSGNLGDGDPGQSFTTLGSAVKMTKVSLLLRRITAAPSDVYAEVRTNPTGAVLGASQIINSSTVSTSPVWVDFRFSDQVALNPAVKYYIRLRSTPSSTDAGSGSAGLFHWLYTQTPPSIGPGPLIGGEAIKFIGQYSVQNFAGIIEPDKDFGFKMYVLQ